MKIEELSLAEIVTLRPKAASLFESMNLDFCCKGKQKLNEALQNDSSKLDLLINKLEILFNSDEVVEKDFTLYSLTELIDYIVSHHHQYVKMALPVILKHLGKIVSKHGEKNPELKAIEKLFNEITLDFQHHMMKEELVLFPKIKEIENGVTNEYASIETIISVMEIEHNEAGKMMDEIRQLSKNYIAPANACVTYKTCFEELKMFEADLHKHVHLENNLLFQKAIALQKEKINTLNSCNITL